MIDESFRRPNCYLLKVKKMSSEVRAELERFVSIDFETTGRDPREDRVTEIGIIVFEGGEIVERYGQLVNPGRPIPHEVTQVTGIRDEDVANMPRFQEVADEVIRRVEGQYLLAYNADYDVTVLRSELGRIGKTVELRGVIDPLPFAWQHLRRAKKTKSARLGDVAQFLGIDLENAHRATDDAEAAGNVFLKIREFVVGLPSAMRDVLDEQKALSIRMEETFARFRSNRGGGGNVLNAADVVIELGAGFVRGEESDPIRYLFRRLPDVRDIR